jgi:nicotinamidase/pyrazinamidase
MSDETALADLLEFVLSGRPERLADLATAQMPASQRADLGAVTDAIAALGLALEPVAPDPALRARILASVRERSERPSRSALVVCDMINDHLTPGRTLEVPRARDIVAALASRIGAARAAGTPVVYVLDRHQPGDPELDEWGTHALEGSDGAEVWPALAPAPDDLIVTKPTYSGFHGTNLEQVLDNLGVDTIILTGCATEVQLMSTATDALQRGFAVELPADSQAGGSEVGEAVTMKVVGALLPYVPARRQRLAKIAERIQSAGSSEARERT